MSLELRIERLERRNRWLATGGASLLIALLLVAQGKSKPENLSVGTLRAKEIWVHGEGKANVHISPTGVGVFDSTGELYLQFFVSETGAQLHVSGPGDAHAGITANKSSAKVEAIDGRNSVAIQAIHGLDTGLSILDKHAVRVCVDVDDGRSALYFYDTKTKKRLELAGGPEEKYALTIYDKNEKVTHRFPKAPKQR